MSPSERDGVYLDIPGWFDFADFYQQQVDRLADGARIVETGVYLGKSTAFMAEAIQRSGKRIQFDAIDLFLGVPKAEYKGIPAADDFNYDDQEAARENGTLEAAARRHLEPVKDYVNVRCADALAAAADYADGSLDVVFLDDAHDTPHVLAELEAWWPKVKPGGVLAGHDYNWPSVTKAVSIWTLATGRAVDNVSVSSWAVEKPVPAPSWGVAPEKRRCLVAVACNERNVPTATVKSLMGLGWGARVTNASQRHGFQAVDFFWSDKRVLVSDLRDDVVNVALGGDYSHVLFLDADMVWPGDLLDRMLAHHARGIVGGLYHLKKWPYWPVAMKDAKWNTEDRVFDYAYDKEAPGSKLLRPEQILGMGCTLIPTEVFRRFERPWFKYQASSSGFSTITEDMWFCQQAAAVGCPIWLDPTVECGHVSQEVIAGMWYDRATHEMAMLANGQRFAIDKAATELVPVAVPV